MRDDDHEARGVGEAHGTCDVMKSPAPSTSKAPMRLWLVLLAACGPSANVIVIPDEATTTEPTSAPEETSANESVRESEPQEPLALPCDVRLDTRITATTEGTFFLEATLTSLGETRTIPIPDRCPSGAVTFRGLPEPYDYYGTCNAGACPGPRTPETFVVGSEPVVVARAVIEPSASPCNAALPPGLHPISAELALDGLRVCTNRASVLEVR